MNTNMNNTHPNAYDRAIAQMEMCKGCSNQRQLDCHFDLAICALEEMRGRERGEPLTLDELGGAWQNGEPVYAKGMNGELIMRKSGVWCVLDGREVAGIGFQLTAVFGHNLTLAQSDYGRTWIAYGSRPGEDNP